MGSVAHLKKDPMMMNFTTRPDDDASTTTSPLLSASTAKTSPTSGDDTVLLLTSTSNSTNSSPTTTGSPSSSWTMNFTTGPDDLVTNPRRRSSEESIGVENLISEGTTTGLWTSLKRDLVALGTWDLICVQSLVCLAVLYANFVIGTVYEQVMAVTTQNVAKAETCSKVFSILLPTLGVVWSYVGGNLWPRLQAVGTASLLAACDILFLIFVNMPFLLTQYLAYICILSGRAIFWVLLYSYVRVTISVDSFTTFIGSVIFLSAVTNILNYGFIYVSLSVLHYNFRIFNVILPTLAILAELWFIYRLRRRDAKAAQV